MCDFVDLNQIELEKIIDKINLSICEIDKIEKFNQDLQNVICVEIVSLERIQNKDLAVYVVTDGIEKFTVVSGDLSLKVGLKVPLVTPGSILFGKKIEISKIANINSFGMLCSEKDLNLSENNTGICILENDTILGSKLSQLYDNEDYIFTIDNKSITHRPDLWSHFGFARELSFQLGLGIKFNPIEKQYSDVDTFSKKIIVNKSDYVHSYYGMVISKVNIRESIPKIRYRLEKCGIRSINNIVDVSNYVLLEVGQPTHFFDSTSLGDIDISINKMYKDKEIKLLDGTNKNCKNYLVISNSGNPVALAGVMGGLDSSVNSDTVEVFLESAVFKREDIRYTIKNTGIRTEASNRYEKGLNPNTPLYVINRIIELLKLNGCSELKCSSVVGFTNNSKQTTNITTSYDYINKKIGVNLENNIIRNVLNSLGFQVKEKEKNLEVHVPEYRSQYDITIQEDLVEEVGRTIGYGSIPLKPVLSSIQPAPIQPYKELERALKNIFSYHLHYNEIYNYSFNSESETSFENINGLILKLKNSMPEEFRYMRASLYPGILRNLMSNRDRFEKINIYEFGRVYFKNPGGLGKEEKFLTFAEYYDENSEFDLSEKKLLTLRDKIYYILEKLNIKKVVCKKEERRYFQPTSGVSFVYNESILAEIGILHPNLLREYGFKSKVYLGKIYYENLLSIYNLSKVQFYFTIPSQFPQDELDISIVMNKEDSTNLYSEKVLEINIPEIEKIYVKSVYTGNPIPEGKKSVTYHLELINYKETFSQEKIKSITTQLIKIAQDSGFQVR